MHRHYLQLFVIVFFVSYSAVWLLSVRCEIKLSVSVADISECKLCQNCIFIVISYVT